ncbi:inositol-tetrakisphosphate 1-kinase-like [Mercenaria mercenaria]|uniref:inositol-tetrakisphosphate 1-kinase-like n=1 Tax=Mercenaria mercenaria TaxID=6596 RepID=UPI001E1D77E0|nr:inositol-tetrakisphosphate 1-kinase-like [Mercenaria mercenaria]
MKRVGYWMSEKKSKKLNFEEHVDMFRNAGVELLKIDIEKPLEEQGPFDMILHKFTDILVKAQHGYITEQRIMRNIEDYIDSHPECIVVDPLDGIRKLLDRHEQYNLVLDCNTVNTESYMFIPTFVDLTSKDVDENRKKLLDANVQYPFVCKPIVAHGTQDCHKMAVIFSEEGLKDITPPCVAQTFVNHNATLYKIFKIGSKQYIGHRPSLKNLYAGDHPTIFFDTHEVCKSDSSHHLTKLDYEDQDCSPLKPNLAQLNAVSETLRQKLGLDLFGVDVIIESDTQRYAVIDINVFPSYDEVDNFFCDLLDHLLFLLNKQQDKHSIISQTTTPQHALLKQTGRSSSLDSCSERIATKRLKTVDQSKERECDCDSVTFPRAVCRFDSNCCRHKQEVMSQQVRRNQRNSAGKTSASRILDDM